MAALLLVAGLAGCSDSDRVGNRTAATVGDAEISQAHVVELMEAQVRFAELSSKAAAKAAKASPDDANAQSQAEQTKSAADDLKEKYVGTGGSAGTDSFGTAGAAEVLTTAIQRELLREAARKAGVVVEASAIKEARQSIVDNLKGQGVTSTKELGALLDLYGELQAYQNALSKEFATTGVERDAQLQAAFAEQLPDQSQYCVNIIATADQASATAAYDRVQAGEDFLAVGNEVSADKETLAAGKELCITGTQLFGVFVDAAKAPLADGTVLAPVEGNGSWIFVRVVSSTVPTYDQLRPQLEQSVPDNAAADKVQASVTKAEKRLGIDVDPRYGTWNAKTLTVEPPKAERSGTTTSTVVAPSTTAGP